MSKHLVVVGGGQAALQTVQSARQLGFDGKVTIVGEEPHPPYQRPPLSKKYLAGSFPRERLYLKPESFYQSKGAELVLGEPVSALDLARHELSIANGRNMAFDYLVLATGSRVRRMELPGIELAGIHYVRTISDIDAIREEITSQSRLVIVGGGYIGLEAAAIAVELGLEVTVLEAAERLLARVVCAELAAFYADYHQRAGVRIHCGAAVSGFTGQDRVTAVTTANGERFPCDLVVIGIGVLPNVELAAEAGLPCDNGILVDACARTGSPGVVAAGDCTRHPHPLLASSVRLESVNNAVEQGKAAASSLFGTPTPFADVPWFWSDQYDLKLQIAGVALDYDDVVLRGTPGPEGFAAFYLAGGRPVAVDAVNSPRDFMLAKKLIAAAPKMSPAEIADRNVDLTRYLERA